MHDSDVPVPTVPAPALPDTAYDAAWVAEAYDSFADGLYAYCRSLVREPSAAADAVRDAFVVTAFRLAELPEESLLRAWLHAVARNECLRSIGLGITAPARDFLPPDGEAGRSPATSPDDTTPDLMAAGPEDDQARVLLRAALGGLDPAERDFMLMTWHGLDLTECAAVLGISRDAASRMLLRGRDQLEASAGVLAAAGSGWRECGQLNGMLDGWDGRLTPVLREQLRQHVDHCDICGDQRRQGLRPAVLQMLDPEALRGMGTPAAGGTGATTTWVTARLRDQVLAAAFDTELASFEHRAMVVRRAGPFRDDGFPVAVAVPGTSGRRRRRSRAPLMLTGIGGTGLLAVAALAALVLSGNHSTGSLPAWTGELQPPATLAGAAAGTGIAATVTPSATPAASKTATATATATVTATPSASASPSAKPPTAAPPPKSAPPVPASTSRINVSPGSFLLTRNNWGYYGEWFTLINPTGTTMSWSVRLPADLAVVQSGGRSLVTSGSLGPHATGPQLYIFYNRGGGSGGGQGGDGGQHSGNGHSTTETVTFEPGNVTVQVTIP